MGWESVARYGVYKKRGGLSFSICTFLLLDDTALQKGGRGMR